ncbi:MAG: hypothetical protein ACOY45_09640 [Pseudomonadota bacterium]
MDEEPLLDLNTLIRRPTVKIDDTLYELLSIDELSVIDNRRFALWAQQLDELQQGDALNPELEALVDTIARKAMVGVPEDVFARLSGTSKIAVVEVFTVLLLRGRQRVAGAAAQAMGMDPSRIGALFSPGSSDSTAATRAPGWLRRLWRWCAPMWR